METATLPAEPAAASGSLTDQLRAATAGLHAAVERDPVFAALATGRIDDAGFRRVLRAFQGVFLAVERRVGGVGPLPPGIPECDLGTRARLAGADLAALGCARRPLDLDADWIVDPASAVGALYVAEGAHLGGRLIARRLADAGRPVGGPGCAFFADGGPAVGARWRAFRRAIDGAAWTDAERRRATASARRTFGLVVPAVRLAERDAPS